MLLLNDMSTHPTYPQLLTPARPHCLCRENSDLSQRLSEAVSGREEAAAALAEAKAEVETLGEQLTAVRSLRSGGVLRTPLIERFLGGLVGGKRA